MIIDKYTLTYRHSIVMEDGKTIEAEEPQTMQVCNCDMDRLYVVGYKNHLLDELFNRMLRSLKEKE